MELIDKMLPTRDTHSLVTLETGAHTWYRHLNKVRNIFISSIVLYRSLFLLLLVVVFVTLRVRAACFTTSRQQKTALLAADGKLLSRAL